MWTRPNNPALDATKTPTAIDIAWSAGFWEGEGSCRGSQTRSLTVTAAQNDTESIFRLRDWFGGNVRSLHTKNPNCHVWESCGDRARIFLGVIYPFLTARRRVQVDRSGALQFLGGLSSIGMTMDQLKTRLAAFNLEERKKSHHSPHYERTEEDRRYQREWMRKYRARKRVTQANVVAIA